MAHSHRSTWIMGPGAGTFGTALAGALLLSLWTVRSPLGLAAESFRVVVNASNPAGSVRASQLSDMFLKKVDRWDAGFRVSPVDQAPDSASRQAFSLAIHRKDVEAVKKYWRKLVFSGLGEPPPELGSDAAVLDFVGHNAGGVGYVSADAAVPDRVRVLKVVEDLK